MLYAQNRATDAKLRCDKQEQKIKVPGKKSTRSILRSRSSRHALRGWPDFSPALRKNSPETSGLPDPGGEARPVGREEEAGVEAAIGGGLRRRAASSAHRPTRWRAEAMAGAGEVGRVGEIGRASCRERVLRLV